MFKFEVVTLQRALSSKSFILDFKCKNHSCQSSERGLRPFRTTLATRNRRRTLDLTQSPILKYVLVAATVIASKTNPNISLL